MRVSTSLVSMLLLTAAAQAQAQAAATVPAPAAKPAAAVPAPAAKPAAAAPAAPVAPAARPAAAPPAPAVAAPVSATVVAPAAPAAAAAAPSDAFNLKEALSEGTAMSADDVAKRAVKTSPSVQKAQKAAEKAQAAAEQANLQVYPRLELEARYTRLSDTGPGPFKVKIAGTEMKFTPKQIKLDQFMLEGRLMYPVSALFFSVLPRYRAAMFSADASRLQSTVEGYTIASMAKEAYYNYARARASLMVARAALVQAQAHRKDVDALVTSGTAARVELMRADAQVSAAKVAVSRVEGSVAVARVALCALLHMELTDFSVNEDLEQVLPALPQDTNGYLASALKTRAEVTSLRTLSNMHNELINAQQGDQLPQLAVGASADLSNPNQRWSSTEDKWYSSWAAYASITWSPNDYASAGKGVDQTRADLAQVLSDLENVEDALRTEVAQAVEDYNAARAAMEASLAGIAAAEESYRVRREQFRAGAATATDVIDAEAELRQARLDLVNASIDGRIAKARLDRAIQAD